MSELIKREDAINAVEMFFKDAYIEDADVHCTDMVYEINHIPAASPWHRVEEELPKQGEWVLVVSRFARMRIDFMDSKGRWYRTCGVTHWMPLPEPPQEVQE